MPRERPAREPDAAGTFSGPEAGSAVVTRGMTGVNVFLMRIALGVALALALPATAWAHLERPSYWPDPRPDTSVTPAAGGEVPTARSLASAVTGAGPGEVRVVCQRNSLTLAKRSIEIAREDGYRLRPASRSASSRRKLAKRHAEDQPRAQAQVHVRLDPGRGQRVGQQRPHRDHARPLHRAEVARGAGQRPEVQPVAAPGRPDRPPDAELRVPGRPARTTRTSSTSSAARSAASRCRRRAPTATASPSRSTARACAATCRSRARA